MVLVFKTSVRDVDDVEAIRPTLDKMFGQNCARHYTQVAGQSSSRARLAQPRSAQFTDVNEQFWGERNAAIGLDGQTPSIKWNFDLEDCDNIFRVVHSVLPENEIVALFQRFGFECEVLEDVVPNTTAPFDSGSTRVRLRSPSGSPSGSGCGFASGLNVRCWRMWWWFEFYSV